MTGLEHLHSLVSDEPVVSRKYDGLGRSQSMPALSSSKLKIRQQRQVVRICLDETAAFVIFAEFESGCVCRYRKELRSWSILAFPYLTSPNSEGQLVRCVIRQL